MATTLPNTGAIIPAMTEQPDQAVNNAAFTAMDAAVGAHTAESASKHITESGSNPNGRYLKFDDGTMIVHRFISAIYDWEVAATTYSFKDFDLPASFINSNYVVSMCGTPFLSGGYPTRGATLSAVATNTSSVRAFVTTGSYACDQVRSLSLICVGRWKA